MAQKKKEEKVAEEVIEQGGDMKMKAPKKPKPTKPKQLVSTEEESDTIKVDLDKLKENKPKEEPKEEVKEEVKKEEVVEEIKDEKEEEKKEEKEEAPVVEEITDEKVEEEEEEEVPTEKEVVEEIKEAETTGQPLPENIQKVMDFMNDTGGSLEDYVNINQDYSKHDDISLLREYYKQTKSHLDDDEISFLIEDNYSFDENNDDEIDVKRKKLALKEQVANAKTHLDGLKSKYYEEIKAGVKLTPEQQKAMDFFNRHDSEQKELEKANDIATKTFLNKTNQVFNKNFKGFEYNVGDKRFRFNVKDVDKVKTTQSDINNFVSQFVDQKTKLMDNASGYHKSLFTAMNSDAIANHFYQQGKTDAIKESIAKSKNISMDPRSQHTKIETGGTKYRVISGDDSDKLRVRNFRTNKIT
jgi:hypothetical protein